MSMKSTDRAYTVTKTEEKWREELSPAEYREWLVAVEGPACDRDWNAPPPAELLPSRPIAALVGRLAADTTPADPDAIRAIRARKDRP